MNFKPIYEYYWLRPENALWRARDFQIMADVEFERPSLDFGAGDGAVSFLRAGGRLAPRYDAFTETLDTSKFFAGADVYDQFHDVEGQIIAKPANYTIDVGFDLKANLAAKARKLNFYGDLVIGDGNDALPFANAQFRTIFSNIVYWLRDPVQVMSELSRITAPDGKLVLYLPSDRLADYSFYNKHYMTAGQPAAMQFLQILDMGRLANNIKIARSAEPWEEVFANAGLQVLVRRNHISGALVRLWDVGLRPFSPFLIDMANRLAESARDDVKRRWVDETYPLFEGFLNVQPLLEAEEPPAFYLYILGKA